MHRVAWPAPDNSNARILLASFSRSLAEAIAKKILVPAPECGGLVPRIKTTSFPWDRRATLPVAKDLEFKAVVVTACDEGVLTLDERVAAAADEAELDGIYETPRCLVRAACARAYERVMLTGVRPASE